MRSYTDRSGCLVLGFCLSSYAAFHRQEAKSGEHYDLGQAGASRAFLKKRSGRAPRRPRCRRRPVSGPAGASSGVSSTAKRRPAEPRSLSRMASSVDDSVGGIREDTSTEPAGEVGVNCQNDVEDVVEVEPAPPVRIPSVSDGVASRSQRFGELRARIIVAMPSVGPMDVVLDYL